jgi:hypothetical protein
VTRVSLWSGGRRSYTWERDQTGRWEHRRIISGAEKETKGNRRWTSEPMSVGTREMLRMPMILRHLFCLTLYSKRPYMIATYEHSYGRGTLCFFRRKYTRFG